MIKELITKKMLTLFISMAIIGFFIGYDYALITLKDNGKGAVNISDQVENINRGREADTQTGDDFSD